VRKSSRAVFLDRDGTILDERGYLGDPNRVRIYSSAYRGLKRLRDSGFQLIVLTNQSGVGRGYFSLKNLRAVHLMLRKKLLLRGVRVDAIYFCPHRPDAGCGCRKPKPGMALKAARERGVDLKNSFVIGDQMRDLELARRIRAKGILVLTGGGREILKKAKRSAEKVTSNLDSASRWIIRETQSK